MITLLRSELDLKTGEITEARGRVSSLESQTSHIERVNVVAERIASLGQALNAAADRQMNLEQALREAEDRRLVSMVSLEKSEEVERTRLRELEDVKIT